MTRTEKIIAGVVLATATVLAAFWCTELALGDYVTGFIGLTALFAGANAATAVRALAALHDNDKGE